MKAFSMREIKRTALISFCASVMLVFSACEWNREYELKRLPAGENRSIVILADTGAEITSTIFYQVTIGDQTVVSTCRICNAAKDPRSLSFKTLSASSGNLIAVYEETNPESIVVLHDFSEGKSWPRGAPEEDDAAITRTGERLLKKLQQEYVNSNLKLNGEACGIKSSTTP
jgi:hypothetical protein